MVNSITLPVVTQHWKTQARATDLDIRPTITAFASEKLSDTAFFEHEFPVAVRLLTYQIKSSTCLPITVSAAFGNQRIRSAVTVQVLNQFHGYRSVATSFLNFTLRRLLVKSSSVECFYLLATR